MIQVLLLVSAILLLCVVSSKILDRFGMPSLIIFMGLGMLFGSDVLGIIHLNNYELTRQICSVALIFIIFHGGFGTSWKHARPVAVPAALMASVGVFVTATVTSIFCVLFLKVSWLEGILIGSVIGSTDAASTFSILRSRNLSLKGGLASLLEMESGSNDPTAYMMTIIIISMILQTNESSIVIMFVKQIGIGLGLGGGLAVLLRMILNRVDLGVGGMYSILMLGTTLLGFALSEYLQGNGYLCVYVLGIILGNSKFPYKRALFPVFDAFSWSMQIILFFTLGLLSSPARLPSLILPGLGLFLFMLFISRPIASFITLPWFRIPIKQQLLVAFVGLRGAASIVFAIVAASSLPNAQQDIFHLVFMVCILSILGQGALMPWVAHRLKLVEANNSILKTFTDYEDELPSELLELKVRECSPLVNSTIKEAIFPEGTLIVMIKRGNQVIIPNGATIIRENDRLVVSTEDRQTFEQEAQERMNCEV